MRPTKPMIEAAMAAFFDDGEYQDGKLVRDGVEIIPGIVDEMKEKMALAVSAAIMALFPAPMAQRLEKALTYAAKQLPGSHAITLAGAYMLTKSDTDRELAFLKAQIQAMRGTR